MANLKASKKSIRQTEKRTTHNRVYRSSARTYIKKARLLISQGKLDEAEEVAQKAYSILDKSAAKHILHDGNAARRKGRLMGALAKARAAAQK